MRSEILAMGIIISLAGIIIALSNSYQSILGNTVYPYALVGAIVLLVGFVACVIAFAVPTQDIVTVALHTEGKEEISKEEKYRSTEIHPKKPKLIEETYSPIYYIGGHPRYKNRTIGYIVLKPESISFKTGAASLHKMDLEIPIKPTMTIDVKKKYFVLTYEDSADVPRDLVFEPEGDAKRRMPDLITRMKYLIRKGKMGREIEDPLKILKIRYAKGEITEKQYKEMKKILEES